MTITITKDRTEIGIKKTVDSMSGINIDACLQCRKCSSGCPVSEYSGSSPSEIIRYLQTGAADELFKSEMIWMCASCGTCFERCPMKINAGGVIDALRILAMKRGAGNPRGNMPLMNSLLLGTMRIFGRTYDLGAMAFYKVKTSTYMNDTDKISTILKKGKIALLPATGADRRVVKRIFNKTARNRGKS